MTCFVSLQKFKICTDISCCHYSPLGDVARLPEHCGAVGEAEPVGRRRREALQDPRVELVVTGIGRHSPQGHPMTTTPRKSSKLPKYQGAHIGAITLIYHLNFILAFIIFSLLTERMKSSC